jgi:hypothetical protein
MSPKKMRRIVLYLDDQDAETLRYILAVAKVRIDDFFGRVTPEIADDALIMIDEIKRMISDQE